MSQGITEANRALLERMHREFERPFRAADIARLLGIPQPKARRLLAWLQRQGWLTRVDHGFYAVVPLGATSPTEWRIDPWVVAATLFAPCYIGGWSACEHWGLTEQVSRETVVMTARPVRRARIDVQGLPYRLRGVARDQLFGLRPVWRGRVRIEVSDPARTVVDVLDDPTLGGGIRHVSAVVREFFHGEHRDDQRLIDYATRRGNRALFKRLGFLIETLGIDANTVIESCQRLMSPGLSPLDPSAKGKATIRKRWNLRVNVKLDREAG
jgi:predicted transcriptional regulator of viral defense system